MGTEKKKSVKTSEKLFFVPPCIMNRRAGIRRKWKYFKLWINWEGHSIQDTGIQGYYRYYRYMDTRFRDTVDTGILDTGIL